jgi:hypothetical protein
MSQIKPKHVAATYRLCLYISKVRLLVPVNELFDSQFVFAFFNWSFGVSKFWDGRCLLLPFGRISLLVSINRSTQRGTLTQLFTSVSVSAKTANIAPCSTFNDYDYCSRYRRKVRWMRRFVVRPVGPGVSEGRGAYIFRVKQSVVRHSNVKLLDAKKTYNSYRFCLVWCWNS